jgi:hypothetical protein
MPSANSDSIALLAPAAWADGSSRNKVTEELQRKGFPVKPEEQGIKPVFRGIAFRIGRTCIPTWTTV